MEGVYRISVRCRDPYASIHLTKEKREMEREGEGERDGGRERERPGEREREAEKGINRDKAFVSL